MNILMVYPRYPDTFWSFKHVMGFMRKKAAYPPLGLMTVAAMLPHGWNKRLVDLNVSELKEEDVRWADMVFISAMLVQKAGVEEVIARCKGKVVVAGGPLFTSQRIPGVDHYVLNEAEVTLPRFLRDLAKGSAKKVYSSKIRPDIRQTPIPQWDLIDFRDYMTVGVQYSRGCPFNCEFCDIVIMNGRVPRTKTPEQVINELQALYRTGYRGSLFLVDDNFIGNKARVKELLPVVIEWQKKRKYPFKFLTEASINLADDEHLMELMSAANFFKVFLGLETPSTAGLEECSKMQNTKRSLPDAVWRIHQHGMQVMGGFIVGFDSDTEHIFQAQIEFIQKIGVVTAMVGLLNAIPQTRLWNRLKDEGRLLSDSTGENTDATINFVPKMDTAKLIEGYKRILSTIYSPRVYYERINQLIAHYRPTVRSHVSWRELHAFFMSMWRIGVVSRSRFLYWKLIFKTLFTKIRAFPVAVELAICGLHFEKSVQRIV